MHKYKCYIIDDEPLAIEVIERYLSEMDQFEVAGTETSAIKGFSAVSSQAIDLLFVDIQMPGLTGLELIESLSKRPQIIITTAYREFALEGFDLNVLDYLVKPIAFSRFLQAIDKFLNQLELPASQLETVLDDHIFIQADRKKVKLLCSEILFVEGVKDYVRVVTNDNTFLTKGSIGIFLKELPERDFVRLHKSFIVGVRHITAFTNNDVEIGAKEVPIGRAFRQDFLRAMGSQ